MKREIEAYRRKRDLFRHVFSSVEGKKVLAYILEDLYWTKPASSPSEFHLQEYAKTLLGYTVQGNVFDYVEQLMKIEKGDQ